MVRFRDRVRDNLCSGVRCLKRTPSQSNWTELTSTILPVEMTVSVLSVEWRSTQPAISAAQPRTLEWLRRQWLRSGLGDHAVAEGGNPMLRTNTKSVIAKLAPMLLFALTVMLVQLAQAQTYSVIHNFAGGTRRQLSLRRLDHGPRR